MLGDEVTGRVPPWLRVGVDQDDVFHGGAPLDDKAGAALSSWTSEPTAVPRHSGMRISGRRGTRARRPGRGPRSTDADDLGSASGGIPSRSTTTYGECSIPQ